MGTVQRIGVDGASDDGEAAAGVPRDTNMWPISAQTKVGVGMVFLFTLWEKTAFTIRGKMKGRRKKKGREERKVKARGQQL
jgi:hypothetical protein